MSAPAAAQTPDQSQNAADGTGYIGVSGAIASEYPGSGEEDFLALPYLSLNNVKGFDFFGTALTYRLIETGTGEGLGLNVAQDILGGHGGLVADASVGTFIPLGNLKIQPSASISWADNNYNDSFFSVTPDQAATSGLAEFDAGSGIYAHSIGVVSWVEIQEKYAISVFANYRWFTGDAADSPILNADDGSRNGIFAAVSLSRKFDTTKW